MLSDLTLLPNCPTFLRTGRDEIDRYLRAKYNLTSSFKMNFYIELIILFLQRAEFAL